MCLLIASPDGLLPSGTDIQNAAKHNPDGWGVAWAEGGEVKTKKAFKLSKLQGFLHNLRGKPYILHFRFATHGSVDVHNNHPFKVVDGLWMAHNGILGKEPIIEKKRSDTWHYATRLGRIGGVKEYIGELIPIIEDEIGAGNKIAFLQDSGEILIANEVQGHWEQRTKDSRGLWYSNYYSLGPLHAGVWEYDSCSYYSGTGSSWSSPKTANYYVPPNAVTKYVEKSGTGIPPWDPFIFDGECSMCGYEGTVKQVVQYGNAELCRSCRVGMGLEEQIPDWREKVPEGATLESLEALLRGARQNYLDFGPFEKMVERFATQPNFRWHWVAVEYLRLLDIQKSLVEVFKAVETESEETN